MAHIKLIRFLGKLVSEVKCGCEAVNDLEKAFDVLGVSPGDDAHTVRKAWRALVRTYHPDIARNDPEGANRRLTEINTAFDAVCACTAEDLRKLERIRLERARHAAKIRQEQLLRRKKLEKTRQAAQERSDRTNQPSTGSEKTAHRQRDAKRYRQGGPNVTALTAHSKSEDASKINALTARADHGFLEATKICSRIVSRPKRSIYL